MPNPPPRPKKPKPSKFSRAPPKPPGKKPPPNPPPKPPGKKRSRRIPAPPTSESERATQMLTKMRDYLLQDPTVWEMRSKLAYTIPDASSKLYDDKILTFGSATNKYRKYTKEELENAFKLGATKRKRDAAAATTTTKKRRLITTEKEDMSMKLQKLLMTIWKKLKVFRRGSKKTSMHLKKKWEDNFVDGPDKLMDVKVNIEAKYYTSINDFAEHMNSIASDVENSSDQSVVKMARDFRERIKSEIKNAYDLPGFEVFKEDEEYTE